MAKISKSKFNYRVKTNENRLESILDKLDIHGSDRATAKKFFQGSKGLHTKASLDRIRTINKQIDKGTFNLRKRMSHSINYKNAVQDFVKKNPDSDIKMIWKNPKTVFQLENRNEFYFNQLFKNSGDYKGTSIEEFNSAREKNKKGLISDSELVEKDEQLQNDYNDWKGNSDDPTDTLDDF